MNLPGNRNLFYLTEDEGVVLTALNSGIMPKVQLGEATQRAKARQMLEDRHAMVKMLQVINTAKRKTNNVRQTQHELDKFRWM